MSQIEREQVEAALAGYTDPYLGRDLLAAKAIKGIDISEQRVRVELELGYPVEGSRQRLESALQQALQPVIGGRTLEVALRSRILAHKTQNNLKSMAGGKNIIAVASGKGGVGKSTTTVNLALAMAAQGARVGILDADIYGPSQGLMLGIQPGVRPEADGDYLLPLEVHGVQAMSMSFLVDEDQPMVWRGPMVSGALQQLLNQTRWQDLDYLFVDMPPGTGDIQLTLSQKVPVTGAVIVTTPQDIALLDARKGIEMFRKVDINVLGIIENMSLHICSQCGHAEPIFGAGGGERIAQRYDTELLGQLPLALSIREQADSGHPSVLAEPEGEVAALFADIALKLAGKLAVRGKNYANVFPEIVVQND